MIAASTPATEDDWSTEYLSPDLSVKLVYDVDAAMAHIRQYGSTRRSIITEDAKTAEKFLNGVDSAVVMHNASTVADGGEFGMGAKVVLRQGGCCSRACWCGPIYPV